MKESKSLLVNFFEKENITLEMFNQASNLINTYAVQKIMVKQSPDNLYRMAQNNYFCVACDNQNNVIACGGITTQYPDGSKEFGAWAVHSDHQNKNIGKQVLMHVLHYHNPKEFIFTSANEHSARIFERLGATRLSEDQIHQDVFISCPSCACPGKENKTTRCAYVFFNLKTIEHR